MTGRERRLRHGRGIEGQRKIDDYLGRTNRGAAGFLLVRPARGFLLNVGGTRFPSEGGQGGEVKVPGGLSRGGDVKAG